MKYFSPSEVHAQAVATEVATTFVIFFFCQREWKFSEYFIQMRPIAYRQIQHVSHELFKYCSIKISGSTSTGSGCSSLAFSPW